MERTPLLTDFVCLATAGATVDGREITALQLQEMAESYDPKTYTANIWPEHNRWWNFGQVAELQLREEDGKTKLYGRLAPNIAMIEYNQQGQGLFLSVEIAPNFANTGKAYLIGLAVTDSPASLGTTQLNFSIQPTKENVMNELQVNSEESKKHFFSSFFHWLFTNENQMEEVTETPAEKANSGNPEPEGNNTMNKAEFAALFNQILDEREKAQQQTAQAEPAEDEQTVSRAEYNALKAELDELKAKFNTATQTETTPTPTGAGGVAENSNQHFNVDFAM